MDQDMQQYLDKAEVLIEALTYIQRFNRKIIVVKYGGSAMLDEELQKNVIKDVTFLKLVGFKPIIVHGGGKEISKWVSKAGMEPKFIDGLRVTDAETMEIAEMVLNKVNKNLVRMVEELGVRAIGVSGKDGGLLRVDKKLSMTGQDVGFVGDIKKVNAEVLLDLLDKIFSRSYARLESMMITTLIISMRMMQLIRSQKRFMLRSLRSSLILKGYTETTRINLL